MRKRKIIILTIVMAMAVWGCGGKTEDPVVETPPEPVEEKIEESVDGETDKSSDLDPGFFKGSGKEQFELTSDDLHDGVWDGVIANTGKGENASPALKWDPVDGANMYVVYMVDTSANNWVHWKSDYTDETELPRGSASKEEYVGPYPPSGTHTYEVYVIALSKPVEKIKGMFDKADEDIPEKMMELDKAEDGSEGNIVGFGHISGTYTKPDEAEAEPEEEDESGEEEVSDKTAIITVPDLDEAFDLLSEGKCDAVALTINTAEAYVKKSDGKISLSNVYFEQTSEGGSGGNVVAAKKGEESFIEKISTIIKFAEDKGYYQTWSAVAMEDCGLGDSYTAKIAKNAPKSDRPVDDTYMYLLDSSALKKPTLDLSDASGVLKEVLDRKKLVIATSPDFPPAEYKDSDGVIYGREMVLAKYIADCLGVSLEIKEMTFDEVLSSLDKGEVDLAISGLAWKQDRADKYELSCEYEKGKTEDTLVVLTENAEEYHSLSDFAGKKIAVQNGSTQQTYVEEQILPLEDEE